MLIVSIPMMVDGIFIANTQGASGLAAINLSMPIILLTNSISPNDSSWWRSILFFFNSLGKGNLKG